MKTKLIKSSVIVFFSATLSACIVVPQQPVEYRMSNAALPTYVNGQYIGVQAGDYIVPSPAHAHVTASGSSIVYLPALAPPATIYGYNTYIPYDSSAYTYPSYSVGTSVGTSFGMAIGLNVFRECCMRGSDNWHRHRHWGGHRGRYR
ncbi:MAG: hypothetical protein K0R08_2190 [Solimicrobium sp.]|jgi:hypothetical protein|nr:hypothetical protein [Solimicrobium sp.]